MRLHGRAFEVVNLDTGEPVENVKAWLWGKGSLMTQRLEGEEEGLLTPEHLDEEADHLALVIPCPAAVRF